LKLKLDHFGWLAPLYEHFIPPRLPEKMLELLNLNGGESVLDAGGGTGRLAQYVQGRAARVVIADESQAMMEQAGAKDGLEPVRTHTERLPFAPQTFERIMMVDALHHVSNQAETALELWRILKPGGRLVIEEPNIQATRVKWIALAEKLALMRSHFLSGAEIQNLFQQTDGQVHQLVDGPTLWVVVDKDLKD
jgi:demethylmenaquinone methyltransferase/2-methoxy-6-polyprenyl-1,4-benzoquinol methylase